jgi:Spy/CpxP family protein refolding chaperone
MRIRTLLVTGTLALMAALGVAVSASTASAATVHPADCIWNGGNPICYPNQ